ncbi:hypothetical protein BHE74_00036529 [Ensete ventricosum]|nr:hypothetical protein BHE74_00036529 [Ensete ventricosum]
MNAAASSWAATITLRSKGADVTLLVAYALATVLWVRNARARASAGVSGPLSDSQDRLGQLCVSRGIELWRLLADLGQGAFQLHATNGAFAGDKAGSVVTGGAYDLVVTQGRCGIGGRIGGGFECADDRVSGHDKAGCAGVGSHGQQGSGTQQAKTGHGMTPLNERITWRRAANVDQTPALNSSPRSGWILSRRLSVRASERQLAPERLAQLFVALSFADTSVSQQTRIQTSQLMAAGDAALPQHQVGDNAQRQGGLGVYSFFFEEQIGTECTFHDDILPLVAGLGSGLTDANDPPPPQDSLDTVHLYCEGPVNCLRVLYCTEMGQLYLSALKQCEIGIFDELSRIFR